MFILASILTGTLLFSLGVLLWERNHRLASVFLFVNGVFWMLLIPSLEWL